MASRIFAYVPARLLLWVTVAFTAGIAAMRLFPVPLPQSPVLPAVCILLALASFLASFVPRRFAGLLQFGALAVLFFLLGSWAAKLDAPELPFPSRLEPYLDKGQTTFFAEVASPPDYLPGRLRVPVRLICVRSGGQWLPLEAGVLLTLRHAPGESVQWAPGDRLIARAMLKRFRSFQNPGAFDYVRYQAELGLHAQANLEGSPFYFKIAPQRDARVLSRIARLRGAIDRFRQHALFVLQGAVQPDEAGFLAALLLGYQRLLAGGWQEHITRTGLNHLLTVSGLHLGLVSLFVFWAVRIGVRLLFPSILVRSSDRHAAMWPAFFAALAYAFLSGFAVPPIWRSMLMLAVCVAAASRYRLPDPLTVVALSALVILVSDPNSFFHVSFQLTFACVLAIIVLYPRFERLRMESLFPMPGAGAEGDARPAWDRGGRFRGIAGKILRPFEDAFWISVAVSLFVLPLSVFYFHGLSLSGFAANIILVPYVGFLVLPLGLIGIAVLAVSETGAILIFQVTARLVAGAMHLIQWFSDLSWSYFWVGGMSLSGLAAVYAFFALALSRWSFGRKAAGAVLLVAILLAGSFSGHLFSSDTRSAALRADFIDVGQGTATLVRFPSGETMLVDGGGFRDDFFDMGRNVIAPFLWHEGIRRVDIVVLSHDHPDHRNGLRFVLSHFEVGAFWTNGLRDPSEPAVSGDLAAIARRRGIPVRTASDIPSNSPVGGCRVKVLHPRPGHPGAGSGGDVNDTSIVLRIDFGRTSLILPGDIGREVEGVIFKEEPEQSRVLLASPHHGSDRSNSPELYDFLRPQAVVFSCGYGNRYGFPSARALEECGRRGALVYRTDLQGAVHAASDGEKWTIRTETD